jgi:serine/threonine-protein kinase
MTRAGVMMGTPLYMAPEQCRNASDVDDKADVYSLGVMLYRMLAGKPPFSAPGTGELMAMHIYMQPPPLQGVNAALPESLVALVHRMLAKNRVERPSMAQVAQELDQIGAKSSGMVPALPSGMISGAHSAARPAPAAPWANESATILSDNSSLLATRPIAPTPGAQRRRRVWPWLLIAGLVLLAAGAVLLRGPLRARWTKPAPSNNPVVPKDPTGPDKPRAAAKIRWRINSNPPGAAVHRLDNDQAVGTTPFDSDQEAKPGTVEVELRLDGYKPVKLTLAGDKDEEQPTATLEPDKPGKPERPKREHNRHNNKK